MSICVSWFPEEPEDAGGEEERREVDFEIDPTQAGEPSFFLFTPFFFVRLSV